MWLLIYSLFKKSLFTFFHFFFFHLALVLYYFFSSHTNLPLCFLLKKGLILDHRRDISNCKNGLIMDMLSECGVNFVCCFWMISMGRVILWAIKGTSSFICLFFFHLCNIEKKKCPPKKANHQTEGVNHCVCCYHELAMFEVLCNPDFATVVFVSNTGVLIGSANLITFKD